MQFKPITVIAVLLLVVASLLVSGCTTSNTSTATPTATATPTVGAQATATVAATPDTRSLAAGNLAGAIDAQYKSKDYTVNTPFKVTKSGDTITYTGIITDGPKVLTPYKRDITIVLTPTRTSARTIYQTSIDAQKAKGYEEYLTSNSSGSSIYWIGYLGTTSSSNPSTPKVYVIINEPSSYSLYLPGNPSTESLSTTSVKDYFEVITTYQTLAA
jgi:hypothetical protein